jgi:hypothetical protein
MKNCIITVCTDDYFQWYIPLFCYSISRIDPTIEIHIFLRGKPNGEMLKIITSPGFNHVIIHNDCFANFPHLSSTTNALRFVMPDVNYGFYDNILITDIDFILFPTTPSLFDYHINGMKENKWCFYGHHGPWKKGCPFEGGWVNDHERIAGGFFMITQEWLARTTKAREKHYELVKQGPEGLYREEDEVILCKIQKESGLPVPQNKHYPQELRGIHLGDFKFKHRWTNMNKMGQKLTDMNCRRYRALQKDKNWQNIVSQISEPIIKEQLQNLETHLKQRKM